MENQKRDELIALYDLYNTLLTEKQKVYFEEYYFSDLSISEIAENHNISRNGVFDQIKRVNASLEDYEKKLKLFHKISRLHTLDLEKEDLEKVLDIIKE